MRLAGILSVHSAGNSGPSLRHDRYPRCHLRASFTVGSTDCTDTIAGFSSRGPVTIDGSSRPKAGRLCAGRGHSICPARDSYGPKSGTSMAAPHVAGLVALLVSARPWLKGQVDEIESIIRLSAVPLTTTQSCSVPGSQVPNNTYGWVKIPPGRLTRCC